MTPRALALVALFALSPVLSVGVAHAQDDSAQGPTKGKPGAAGADTKQTAPTIRIHRAKASADGKIGAVCVIAESGSDAVPKVTLTMDSVLVPPRRSASTADEGDKCPPPWDYVVPLVPGMHYLEAAVYAASSDTPATVARDSLLGLADSAAMATTLHIFTVGINRYPAGIDSLSYARSDARAFADSLRRQAAPLFGTVLMDSLYDGDATRDSIIGKLIDIRGRVKPNDTFVFYFAGHGAMENGHMFLAGAEVNSLTNERTLTIKGIRDDDLLDWMADIKGSTLMVLDACHSGQMITAFQHKETRAQAQNRLQMGSGPNMAILAATDSAGLAEENSQLRHGLFTAALLQSRTPGQARGVRKTAYLNDAAGKFLTAWYLEERREQREETHIWKPPTRDFNLVVR